MALTSSFPLLTQSLTSYGTSIKKSLVISTNSVRHCNPPEAAVSKKFLINLVVLAAVFTSKHGTIFVLCLRLFSSNIPSKYDYRVSTSAETS